jgi:hypothetical protein
MFRLDYYGHTYDADETGPSVYLRLCSPFLKHTLWRNAGGSQAQISPHPSVPDLVPMLFSLEPRGLDRTRTQTRRSLL